MVLDKTWLVIVSELFVNLAAGWWGAILIAPNFSQKKGLTRWLVLTGNLVAGTLSLVAAYLLRK